MTESKMEAEQLKHVALAIHIAIGAKFHIEMLPLDINASNIASIVFISGEHNATPACVVNYHPGGVSLRRISRDSGLVEYNVIGRTESAEYHYEFSNPTLFKELHRDIGKIVREANHERNAT